jgi:hypothetical protein
MAADDECCHGGIGMAYVLLYVKLKQQPQGPKTEGSRGMIGQNSRIFSVRKLLQDLT